MILMTSSPPSSPTCSTAFKSGTTFPARIRAAPCPASGQGLVYDVALAAGEHARLLTPLSLTMSGNEVEALVARGGNLRASLQGGLATTVALEALDRDTASPRLVARWVEPTGSSSPRKWRRRRFGGAYCSHRNDAW